MADDNKNLAGEGERTSILPQSGGHAAEQTEVLPRTCPRPKRRSCLP